MRTRGAVGTALLVQVMVLTVGLSGCTSGTDPVVATDPAPPSAPARPDPAPQRPPTTPVTAADLALVDAFTAYAARPDAHTAAAVPFAREVRLGLGENLFASLGAGDLSDPASWLLGLDAYGRTGPLDVLHPVRAHRGRFRVTVDQRPRCSGRAHRAPARFREARRVTILPTRVESCLDWYAVDLYVDRAGLVRGVTLELWEP